jgi:hypothetical protein
VFRTNGYDENCARTSLIKPNKEINLIEKLKVGVVVDGDIG